MLYVIHFQRHNEAPNHRKRSLFLLGSSASQAENRAVIKIRQSIVGLALWTGFIYFLHGKNRVLLPVALLHRQRRIAGPLLHRSIVDCYPLVPQQSEGKGISRGRDTFAAVGDDSVLD